MGSVTNHRIQSMIIRYGLIHGVGLILVTGLQNLLPGYNSEASQTKTLLNPRSNTHGANVSDNYQNETKHQHKQVIEPCQAFNYLVSRYPL
jgi:hypothetical protein